MKFHVRALRLPAQYVWVYYDFEKDSYVYLFGGNRELTSSNFLIFFEIMMKNSLACGFRQKLICLLNIVMCGIA